MSKWVLIGLLAVSVLAMWGSAVNAFNRINGIIIRHSDLVAEVTLCGDPLVNTQLTLNLDVVVEIACRNPGGHVPNGKPGHPTFPLTFQASKGVTSGNVPTGDFDPNVPCSSGNNNNATATIEFTFPLPPKVKCKPKWTKVPDSELISVSATATWSCTTDTTGECQNAGDTIEAIHVECADTPHTVEGVPCEDFSEHVGMEGAPPPPLVEPCADIHLHCNPDSPVLETVCGAGVRMLNGSTAANISYVTFQGDTSSVVLNHCVDASDLSGATLEIFTDTNFCNLAGGCCSATRWNDRVCSVEIKN
jgi:hypothetical protein